MSANQIPIAVLLMLASSSLAFAEEAQAPLVLRLATVVPEGSAWARELDAVGHEVSRTTSGRVRVKWILGAIAGDEGEVEERLKRGQLDGTASGGPFCERVMPTLRGIGAVGLLDDRDQARYLRQMLSGTLAEEAALAGFQMLAVSGLGDYVLFTRTPVKTLADLRRIRLWIWSEHEVDIKTAEGIGMRVVAKPIQEAARAYDSQELDGFVTIPTAALAFQWSAQVRHLSQLRFRSLTACVLLARRAFDRLQPGDQDAVRAAFAKGSTRVDELTRQTDDQLLGGLFEKQGVQRVALSSEFRKEFVDAARAAREKLIAKTTQERVAQVLESYRASLAKKP